MASRVTKLPERALKLSPQARAALAGKLILSLDDDHGAEAAWVDEIDRRLALVDAGETSDLSWQEVVARIRKTRRGPSRPLS